MYFIVIIVFLADLINLDLSRLFYLFTNAINLIIYIYFLQFRDFFGLALRWSS